MLPNSAPIKLKNKLKLGMLSASIQLTTQLPAHIPYQLPKLLTVFFDATSVPAQSLKYMYLVATDPLTTPATMMVGSAMPNAILVTRGLAEPSAGLATRGPAK